MSSVYNNNATTQSMGEYSDNGNRNGANLTIGEFRNESSIGASKKITAETITASEKTTESQAKTIVKVFKHVENTDGSTTLSLVNMDKSNTSIGICHNNYLKWTGQKNSQLLMKEHIQLLFIGHFQMDVTLQIQRKFKLLFLNQVLLKRLI